MNNGLKNILMFGGGAALLYWLFSKAGNTSPSGNSGVAEVIDTTQLESINDKGNIHIVKLGTANINGKKGVSYQVQVFNNNQNLVYATGQTGAFSNYSNTQGDTVYQGDTPFVNSFIDSDGNPINVYVSPTTTKLAITVVLNNGQTFEVVYDWDGNYLNDSQIG